MLVIYLPVQRNYKRFVDKVSSLSSKELSSDESGLDSKPFPPETRRLRSSAEFDGSGYPNLKATVPLTRSTRRSAR